MGNIQCVAFWKKKAGDTDDDVPPAQRSKPVFDVGAALVPVKKKGTAPGAAPVLPAIALSSAQFLQLQEVLPLHEQRRKWELVYSTAEHGFSLGTLRTRCEQRANPADTSMVLLVVAGGGAVVGALLASPLDWQSRKYHGTNGTCVFAFRRGGEFCCFRPPEPRANSYFQSTADGIRIGGGGKGSALHIDGDDLATLFSSTDCPTFAGYRCLLEEGDGVVFEGGEPRSSILTLELWGIAQDSFVIP